MLRPRPVYQSPVEGTTGVDAVIFGMISQPAETGDRFMSKEISAKLFSANPPDGTGTDLGSLVIQRGRDHGIPGYNEWRAWCGLSVAKTFMQLDDIPYDEIIKFQKMYEHVDDIDLYPAALSEKPVNHGIVGPTFACILAHQFRIYKMADRFWFETVDPMLRFTADQLDNIRQVTLSRVLCDTLDDVDTIQTYSMIQPTIIPTGQNIKREELLRYLLSVKNNNERQPCHKLPAIDFTLWST